MAAQEVLEDAYSADGFTCYDFFRLSKRHIALNLLDRCTVEGSSGHPALHPANPKPANHGSNQSLCSIMARLIVRQGCRPASVARCTVLAATRIVYVYSNHRYAASSPP